MIVTWFTLLLFCILPIYSGVQGIPVRDEPRETTKSNESEDQSRNTTHRGSIKAPSNGNSNVGLKETDSTKPLSTHAGPSGGSASNRGGNNRNSASDSNGDYDSDGDYSDSNSGSGSGSNRGGSGSSRDGGGSSGGRNSGNNRNSDSDSNGDYDSDGDNSDSNSGSGSGSNRGGSGSSRGGGGSSGGRNSGNNRNSDSDSNGDYDPDADNSDSDYGNGRGSSGKSSGGRGNSGSGSDNNNGNDDYEAPPRDCTEVMLSSNGDAKNGVYDIQPDGLDDPIEVYCDMFTDGGGWTVIQKRGDYPGHIEDLFSKGWRAYKNGFGDPHTEYWIGNDNLYQLTHQDKYVLRVDMSDVDDNRAFAKYSQFSIESEDENYKLNLGRYSGTAGDALTYHNGMSFSTTDRADDHHPNDNCAQRFHGGWWYNSCLHANLNGLNLQGQNNRPNEGIIWYEWRGDSNSLAFAEMKIRPTKFGF